jgi:hypothetical protein
MGSLKMILFCGISNLRIYDSRDYFVLISFGFCEYCLLLFIWIVRNLSIGPMYFVIFSDVYFQMIHFYHLSNCTIL